MDKMALTFYCDDTSPYGYPPGTFKEFLDFVASEGIAGESSVILGYQFNENGLLTRPKTRAQEAFMEQNRRAFDCGIDTHMEIMTHWGVYDFQAEQMPEDAIHEGVWLEDPSVTLETYEAYFTHILEEGEKIGIKFTGLTWPGCSCDECVRRRKEIGDTGFYRKVNPKVWQALLNVAKQDKFRTPVVPCFITGDQAQREPFLAAGEGEYGVYDISANASDKFGIWLNDPERVDADYYVSADGKSGRIVELLQEGCAYCCFYMHWQGVNPHNGVGWKAFRTMVGRVRKFLEDRVVWVRPSDLALQAHAAKADEK